MEEIDTSLELCDQEGNLLHSQKLLYENLPNACFKCHKQGHLLNDCPEMLKETPSDIEKEGFITIQKKNLPRHRHVKSLGKDFNRFSSLLVAIEVPFRKESRKKNQEPTYFIKTLFPFFLQELERVLTMKFPLLVPLPTNSTYFLC